jgi:hypothetical protein
LRVEISAKRKEKKNPPPLIMFQRHGDTERERESAQKYKWNGEFLKSEVPGVCATIRGG